MTRSTILYHPNILNEKRESIKKANILINKGQSKVLVDAERILVLNKECEAKLVDQVQTGCKNVLTNIIADEI